MSSAVEQMFFTKGRAERDARCREKDAITTRILGTLNYSRPTRFTAVLMPSMYGPEVSSLRQRGVPARNIFAIERSPSIHALYLKPSTGFEYFKGMRTTPKPMSSDQAADYIPFEPAKLVYLDYFGQPDTSHYVTIFKMMRLGAIGKGTKLVVTFGNRGDTFSCGLNARLKTEAGQAYVEAAAQKASLLVRHLENHGYKTKFHARFSVTETDF